MKGAAKLAGDGTCAPCCAALDLLRFWAQPDANTKFFVVDVAVADSRVAMESKVGAQGAHPTIDAVDL